MTIERRRITILSKRETPPPAWAAVGASVIIVSPRYGHTVPERAELATITKVTPAGIISARGEYKVRHENDYAVEYHAFGHAKALYPDTPEFRAQFAAAFAARQEMELKNRVSREKREREEADKKATAERRRSALTRIIDEVNSLDDDQREALTWAVALVDRYDND